MFNSLNLDVPAYDKAMKSNPESSAKHLRVINALKVFLGIYVVFGNSYLYTYYSLVGDSV